MKDNDQETFDEGVINEDNNELENRGE